jgi:RIO kinase 1
VSGEHRWRKGYCKSNPRKMVKVWAEKELRNYRRLYVAGIKCPQPILLKSHVLVMEFLGSNGWPSPRLKDAQLNERRMRESYVQTILIMRHMFQRCKLVHGDLSEYNLLWHNNEVYVIDVSQSVESDHPSALDFLRKDCANVNDFFRKSGGLQVMTTRQLFQYVTTPDIEDEGAGLDDIMREVSQFADELDSMPNVELRRKATQQEAVDEAVFMSQFLPRSLNQVAEHEIRQMEKGDVEDTYAHAVAALTGNKDVVNAVEARRRETKERTAAAPKGSLLKKAAACGDAKKAQQNSVKFDEEAGDADSDEDAEELIEVSGESDDESDDDEDARFVKVARTPEELQAEKIARRDERRANKKSVKEANLEKRKSKIKKKDKKRAINKTKAGNKKK